MYKTLHKKQGSVTVQLRFARSSVTFCAKRDNRMQLHQPGLVDVFSGKERCKAILDEVDRMPENWQKVAELKLIEGRPTSEVCDQLSISEKACYSRVSRIRKYIKSLLKREDWP